MVLAVSASPPRSNLIASANSAARKARSRLARSFTVSANRLVNIVLTRLPIPKLYPIIGTGKTGNRKGERVAKKVRQRRPVASRKTTLTIFGRPTRRGEKMLIGRYRLVNVHTKRVFVGSLIDTINKGKLRLAIFSVPKG